MTSEQPIPWEQVVPSASNISPQSITRDALLDMFLAGQKPGLNFLLIDVRREDHKVSFDCPLARYRCDCRADELTAGVKHRWLAEHAYSDACGKSANHSSLV